MLFLQALKFFTIAIPRSSIFALPIPCKYNGPMSKKQPKQWFALQPEKTNDQEAKRRSRGRGALLGRSTLDWEFGLEEQAAARSAEPTLFQRKAGPPSTPPETPRPRAAATTPVEREATAARRVVAAPAVEVNTRRAMATRLAMDEALDRWWTDGTLPALALLRDGLLLLEAGQTLDEVHCSFLLRVALRRQRGMITALRYQLDPDRTAFLLKDALLDAKHPLPAKVLLELYREDERSEIWLDYLLHDLAYEVQVAQGVRRQLAARALAQLQNRIRVAPALVAAPGPRLLLLPLSYRWTLRWLLWALLILGLALGYVGLRRTVYAQSVHIPGSSYTISDPPTVGRLRTVALADFRIDLTEVTNGAYQRCIANEVCTPPSSLASATYPDYFTNGTYAAFPVVNVNWDQANIYCTWLGKRLPTREEWEVAASIAPLTQRHFLYPWGDRFAPNLVNGGTPANQDTRAVGTFHPAGDSSFGLRDMAGNVAEWTASPSAEQYDYFVVKGGAYRDSAELLRLDVQNDVARTTTAPWLGFRCAGD